jgi:bifunctional pyridoxal-dependent enzyme with beta-cystathionase and maltose regulon repressor activities
VEAIRATTMGAQFAVDEQGFGRFNAAVEFATVIET